MAGGIASGSSRLSKLLRPPSTDVKAAAMWGVAAGTGALWFVQPFDWLKKTFLEKPETQEQ
ncbi:PREDICTED: ubiquinol-cytochrome c reductase complex 6.7 kDa protein-like [Fragaria vesca subsp. vesca]